MAEPPFEDAFRYTSGRWVFNEAERLKQRYLPFNVHALVSAAARSVGKGAADLTSIRKLAEGGFNRIFELTMSDGLQLIARLPYPSTQPKQLAVASEVATMDLVRHYSIPTPKIYDYSTDANNSVGSEYIIMEKVRGWLLNDVWFSMSDVQRIKLLTAFVELEAKLLTINFPANGSIFYEKDLPDGLHRIPLDVKAWSGPPVCVGPLTSFNMWYQQRSSLTASKGPFMTLSETLLGVAQKEIEWLKTYAKPRLPADRVHRDITDFQNSDPTEHYRSLETVMDITPQLTTQPAWLNKLVLRHPDPSLSNIFISEDYQITSLIDWQYSNVLPLSLKAGIPSHFQNWGDDESENLNTPKLPDNLDEMEADVRESELELYRRRHVHHHYLAATASKNPLHFRALTEASTTLQQKVFEHAGAPWRGNNTLLKGDLVEIARTWNADQDTKTPQPCPISYEAVEAEKILKDVASQQDADTQLEAIHDYLGMSSDGWISNERYDDAMRQIAEWRQDALNNAGNQEERDEVLYHYCFDDFDEDG